ncbi:MAG: hypothetical protein IPH69_15555 [Bacteroidales bacterium]|nr:hypothetical protein [Bacteroidales bacterium]
MKTYMGENYTPPAARGMGQRPPQAAAGQAAPTAPKDRSFTTKFEEWIAACRGGSKNTPGNFASAEALSTMINLGIVSVRAGTRVEFDPVTRKITNNEAANKLLTREYRKGWEL